MSADKRSVGPLPSSYYDDLYLSGGHNKAYHSPVKGNMYEGIWTAVANNVLGNTGVREVLEVGCGSGALAELLLEGGVRYHGVDFSPVAINLAKTRCARFGNLASFQVGDVHSPRHYLGNYTDFVATEVFEHVQDDVLAATLVRSKTSIHVSMPNFFTKSHIRVYKTESDIEMRFRGILKFHTITPGKRTIDIGTTRIVWICSGERI